MYRGEGWRLPQQWVLGNQSTKHSLFAAEGFEIKATCCILWPGKSFNIDSRCVCMHPRIPREFIFPEQWHDFRSNPTACNIWSGRHFFNHLWPTQSKNSVINCLLWQVWPGHNTSLYWSLNPYVQCKFAHSKRKNMLCNTWVVSSSCWTKGSKAEGDDREKWGREKGAGMQPMEQAMHCKGASLRGAVM